MQPLISKMTKVLIIGHGSVGRKHCSILKEIGCTVKVLSRRQDIGDYQCLTQALKEVFDLIVIANETSIHLETLCQLQEHDFKGHIFVEKPLAISSQDRSVMRYPDRIWVGYNLRFHPAILQLKTFLESHKGPVYYAHFHVGQALSTWRKGRDHLKTYSAIKKLGGGVLHDLSHEIDLAQWLFGSWSSIKSFVKKCSKQTIDSEDLSLVIAKSSQGPLVSLNMNYLDVTPTRFIQISSETHTIKVNLVGSTIEYNNELKEFSDGMAKSYKNMWHEMLRVVQGESRKSLCNFSEGRHVLQSIDDIYADIDTERNLEL